MKCNNCGASIDRTATFCGYCGTSVRNESAVAVAAPAAVMVAAPPQFAPPAPPVGANDDDLSPYYRDQFAQLDSYPNKRAKFNWAAFWLGPFWYLGRGMWAKALILFGMAVASGGVAGLFLAIYAGVRGTNDLWLLRRQGKQLW